MVSDPDAEAESASRAPRRPVALITQKQADEMTYGRPGAGAGTGSGAGPPGSRAVAELTEELKSLRWVPRQWQVLAIHARPCQHVHHPLGSVVFPVLLCPLCGLQCRRVAGTERSLQDPG